jgi:hypothetical protein
MRRVLYSLLLTIVSFAFLQAQTGCPGCQVTLPAGLPADTIYLPALPDGLEGSNYDHDFAFRMPKTTTPVAVLDSTTPPGYTISKIELVSLDGLPPGMSWTPNQFVFQPADQTDGCIKFCGTPTLPDSFDITIKIKVTVLIVTKDAYLHLKLYIAPKISATTGFSMTNFTGCGSTSVSFTNNIKSGGLPGFTYLWDFGDNSPVFSGENPPAHTYSTPGTYTVSYHAKVDTAGYILASITILSVDCSDPIGFGNPDLYMQVYDPGGTKKYDSSPDIPNTQLPYTFPINIHMGSGNYNLQVFDEDSGIKGGDDPCGNVSFNILSSDTIVSGGFRAILHIVHTIANVNSKDTVTVYPLPEKPAVKAPNGFTKCAGLATPIILTTTSPGKWQWFYNGDPILNATDSMLTVTQDGYYQVRTTSIYGCSALSDSVFSATYPLPTPPYYTNTNNLLHVTTPSLLPASYTLQWFNGSDAIPGATGLKYCATASGTYGLLVTDLNTHCSNFFAATILFDPNFDCTVGIETPATLALSAYPNPAHDQFTIALASEANAGGQLTIQDWTGKILLNQIIPAGATQWTVDCRRWTSGVYALELISANGIRRVGKLVLMP